MHKCWLVGYSSCQRRAPSNPVSIWSPDRSHADTLLVEVGQFSTPLGAGSGVFFWSFLSSYCWVITGCMCRASSAKVPALLGQALFRQLQELFQLWLHLDDLNRKTTDRFLICSSNMAGSNESLQNIHLQSIVEKMISYSMKKWFNMMLRDGSYGWWEGWMFVFKIEFQQGFVLGAS